MGELLSAEEACEKSKSYAGPAAIEERRAVDKFFKLNYDKIVEGIDQGIKFSQYQYKYRFLSKIDYVEWELYNNEITPMQQEAINQIAEDLRNKGYKVKVREESIFLLMDIAWGCPKSKKKKSKKPGFFKRLFKRKKKDVN